MRGIRRIKSYWANIGLLKTITAKELFGPNDFNRAVLAVWLDSFPKSYRDLWRMALGAWAVGHPIIYFCSWDKSLVDFVCVAIMVNTAALFMGYAIFFIREFVAMMREDFDELEKAFATFFLSVVFAGVAVILTGLIVLALR